MLKNQGENRYFGRYRCHLRNLLTIFFRQRPFPQIYSKFKIQNSKFPSQSFPVADQEVGAFGAGAGALGAVAHGDAEDAEDGGSKGQAPSLKGACPSQCPH